DYLKIPVVFPEVLPGLLYGLGDPPGKIDMVVLEHDHVVEGEPVVLPAPDLDRPFFKGTDPRGGLAGIQDLGPRALEQGNTVPGLGGNGTHALHGVENQTLPLEDTLGTPLHIKGNVPDLDGTAVQDQNLQSQPGIDLSKGHFGKFKPGDHAVLLDQKLCFPPGRGRDTCQGTVVPIPHVLTDGIGNYRFKFGFEL